MLLSGGCVAVRMGMGGPMGDRGGGNVKMGGGGGGEREGRPPVSTPTSVPRINDPGYMRKLAGEGSTGSAVILSAFQKDAEPQNSVSFC
jgi:hypothetical protein